VISGFDDAFSTENRACEHGIFSRSGAWRSSKRTGQHQTTGLEPPAAPATTIARMTTAPCWFASHWCAKMQGTIWPGLARRSPGWMHGWARRRSVR